MATGTSTALRELLAEHTMPGASQLTRAEAGGAVRCLACGHRCLIRPGKAGVCRVRFNRDGQLRVPAGYVAGLQVDPIEKKPFFHAYPGNDALSFGMLGCDLHCSYCQNWVTSQVLRDPDAKALPRYCSPSELVSIAKAHGAPVVVSTYNEPLITAEWAVEVFRPAREAGLVCGFVSNGNATPEVLQFLQPYVSLYKVDLKSFDDARYRKLGCTLRNILDSIARLKEMRFWVEIVTLVIPEWNDSDAELRGMADFLAKIDPMIPWHITAFHPDYHMHDHGRTKAASLLRAYEIGKAAGLNFIYPGNLPGQVGDLENTFCPQCNALCIAREGFYVTENRMRGGHCPNCDFLLPGVWQDIPPRHSLGTGIPTPLSL